MNLKDKILDKAQKFVQKGQFDKAIAEYRNAIDMDPKDVSVRLRAGDLYVKVGKKAEAVREYTEAVNIFEKKGRSGDVAELLRKMVDIDPENVGVRLKLAETYQRQRFDKDALIEYSGVLEKLLAQRKADKAEKIYLQLFAHYGKTPSVLKGLSAIYLAKKDGVQFLKYAKPLLGIYGEEGKIEEGRALCKAILSVKPGDIESESFLERFREPEKEAPSAAPAVEVPEAAPPAPTATPPSPAPPPAPKEEPVGRIEPAGVRPGSKKPAVPPPPPQPVVSASESVEEAGEGEIDITIEGFEEEPLKIEAPRAAAPKGAAEPPQAEEVREEAPPVPTITVEPSYPAHEEAEHEIKEEIKAEPEKAPVEAAEEAEEEKGFSKKLEETLKEAEDFIKQFRETRPTTPAQAPPPPPPAPSHVEAAREEERPAEVVEIIHFEEAVRPPEAHPEEAGVEEVTEVEVLKAGAPKEEARREMPPKESALISEEAISEAIDEIMEREAPPSPPHPARPAPSPETEEIFTPPAGLTGFAPAEEAPGSEFTETFVQEKVEELGITKEEYVDLSAELGIGVTEVETINEFKTGIEKQLGREDTETHYNLGIAYMEMELYKDAEKEFKIALKDPEREFDCFTRLGHCAMAEKTPDEAVVYFQKAMKTGGRSDEERKGVMYELALAYEAANNPGDALPLFKSVYAMDPDFREAALKVRKVKAPTVAAAGRKEEAPAIPMDDSIIEVELL